MLMHFLLLIFFISRPFLDTNLCAQTALRHKSAAKQKQHTISYTHQLFKTYRTIVFSFLPSKLIVEIPDVNRRESIKKNLQKFASLNNIYVHKYKRAYFLLAKPLKKTGLNVKYWVLKPGRDPIKLQNKCSKFMTKKGVTKILSIRGSTYIAIKDKKAVFSEIEKFIGDDAR